MLKEENNYEDFRPSRRLSDHLDPPPTNVDIWRVLTDIRDRLHDIESSHSDQVSAFPKNDLNKPDYDGHRKSHIKVLDDEKIMTNYKIDATKAIIGAIVIFVAGLLATGFMTRITEFTAKVNEVAAKPVTAAGK